MRAIVDAARRGTPFDRIAVLYPAERPYGRLVEHHLAAADVPWNGRPGTHVDERMAPRVLVDVLDLDRRGLRRSNLVTLLADVPARAADGAVVPTARWERVGRAAGVVRESDWRSHLERFAADARASDRWDADADAHAAGDLLAFVEQWRAELGDPHATRPWAAWVEWSRRCLEHWFGPRRLDRLDGAEGQAWEQTSRVLDRLAHLDEIGPPVTRAEFRTTFAAELDVTPGRHGRIGDGVHVSTLAGAAGLDVDLAIVLGAAEGLLPPGPSSDPLLGDHERRLAGLAPSDELTGLVHRQFLAAVTTTPGGARHRAPRRPAGHRDATSVALADAVARGRHDPRRRLPRPGPRRHRVPGIGVRAPPARPVDPRAGRRRHPHASTRHAATTCCGGRSPCTMREPATASPSTTATSAGTMSARCRHGSRPRASRRGRRARTPTSCATCSACSRSRSPSRSRRCPRSTAARRCTRRSTGCTATCSAGGSTPPGPDGWTDEHLAALLRAGADVADLLEARGRTGREAFWANARKELLAALDGWLQFDAEHLRGGARAGVRAAVRRRRARAASRSPAGAPSGSTGRSTASTSCRTARSSSSTTRPASATPSPSSRPRTRRSAAPASSSRCTPPRRAPCSGARTRPSRRRTRSSARPSAASRWSSTRPSASASPTTSPASSTASRRVSSPRAPSAPGGGCSPAAGTASPTGSAPPRAGRSGSASATTPSWPRGSATHDDDRDGDG